MKIEHDRKKLDSDKLVKTVQDFIIRELSKEEISPEMLSAITGLIKEFNGSDSMTIYRQL